MTWVVFGMPIWGMAIALTIMLLVMAKVGNNMCRRLQSSSRDVYRAKPLADFVVDGAGNVADVRWRKSRGHNSFAAPTTSKPKTSATDGLAALFRSEHGTWVDQSNQNESQKEYQRRAGAYYMMQHNRQSRQRNARIRSIHRPRR